MEGVPGWGCSEAVVAKACNLRHDAQKRDSEESCGRVGRRRMYIRLPS